ncbi:membrane protein [Agaricicola taiwanensis]|uniref:Membrane protein n=1 Tax=Agaricicola taiwanensis TaxID=591372 RepID=A0A8J2YMZ2_9RHOB|nr:TerC family protein [Agaricicola taiwanensis]GGE53505.1 membrane protein [Agaricicola taiwanensis]
MDMQYWLSAEALWALGQVIMIDLVLAADNAIVIGLAAAGLPKEQRGKAILVGIAAATVLRIIFAVTVTYLLAIIGLLLAGGVLLLWVCWKMYRELRENHGEHEDAEEALANADLNADGSVTSGRVKKTFAQAATQIVVADVSMSLDNVLAVAGASRDHPEILVIGLAFSVVLMGVAASFIARLLNKYRWIAWVGLLIILYVALKMIYEGGLDVWTKLGTGA